MHGFFVAHPEVVTPPPSTTVWRYMPFWKFQDLASTQTLYFTRVDRFDDNFEGIPPRKVTEAVERLARVAREVGAGSNAEQILRDRAKYKRFFYASCWHMGESESEEMWKRYLADEMGVAIQTSFVGLYAAIRPPFDRLLCFGCVEYIDFEEEGFSSLGPLEPYFRKQASYAYEAELRILLQHFPREAYSERARHALEMAEHLGFTAQIQPPELNLEINTADAIRVPLRLEHLLRRVFLCPWATADLEKAVLALTAPHGDRIVYHSTLA